MTKGERVSEKVLKNDVSYEQSENAFRNSYINVLATIRGIVKLQKMKGGKELHISIL